MFSEDKVYIIAEIGGNHEGNFAYAKKLTNLAIESGADAVKYQIYTNDSLVNKLESPDRHRHFKRFQLSPEQYIELAEICNSAGIDFMASVWNIDAISYIDKYIPIYKIGSGDLTAYNVIKKTVDLSKPMIISTGLATFEEIDDLVAFIKDIDPNYIEQQKLAILQCTTSYPCPDNEANLAVIPSLKKRYNLPVGYSDHTTGQLAAEVAVTLGARILELHFTDSRKGKEFRDHKVSFTRDEILTLRQNIETIHALMGSKQKAPTISEIDSENIQSFRRAVYPKVEIKAGQIVTEDDLTTLRPNNGMDARDFYKIVGKKAKSNLKPLQRLSRNLFE
ncbi:MAG: N-acetylneuraminate synthase family protein [Pseudobacteriovorax sp.]|nr:N-acetylneuraminate synthase family protein [Pseudobacteriovorax sp.]